MDKSTWYYLLLAGLSIVYNIYKKNKKKNAEREAERNPVVEDTPSSSKWDIDSLISEFKDEYGVKTEVEPVQNEAALNETYAHHHPRDNKPVEEEIIADTRPEYVDEVNHTGLDSRTKKTTAYSIKKEEETNEEPEYDLHQMVIHNAILNRPKY